MLAKLTTRKSSNVLGIELTYKGIRFRETLGIKDSRNNRALVRTKLDQVNADLLAGSFDMRTHFPNSKNHTFNKNEKVPFLGPRRNARSSRCH